MTLKQKAAPAPPLPIGVLRQPRFRVSFRPATRLLSAARPSPNVALCFHCVANSFFRNPCGMIALQTARGVHPSLRVIVSQNLSTFDSRLVNSTEMSTSAKRVCNRRRISRSERSRLKPPLESTVAEKVGWGALAGNYKINIKTRLHERRENGTRGNESMEESKPAPLEAKGAAPCRKKGQRPHPPRRRMGHPQIQHPQIQLHVSLGRDRRACRGFVAGVYDVALGLGI